MSKSAATWARRKSLSCLPIPSNDPHVCLAMSDVGTHLSETGTACYRLFSRDLRSQELVKDSSPYFGGEAMHRRGFSEEQIVRKEAGQP